MNVSMYVSEAAEKQLNQIIEAMVHKAPDLAKYVKPTGVLRDALEVGLSALFARYCCNNPAQLSLPVVPTTELVSTSEVEKSVDNVGGPGAGGKNKTVANRPSRQVA